MKLTTATALLMLGMSLAACDRAKNEGSETTEAAEAPAQASMTLMERRAAVVAPEYIVWSQQHMSELFPSRTISRGGHTHPFPVYKRDLSGVQVPIGEENISFEAYLDRSSVQGIVVLHKGTLVYERYFGDADATTRFTSWSVAKSFVSTLIGAAIKDGYIKSVNDQLTDYLPELIGTAYEGVTISQALQMSSGVQFNEDYDPEGGSDVWDFVSRSLIGNAEPANKVAASYPRGAEPGTVFNYNTAETQILGWLVKSATGKSPSAYLEEKIWSKLGMSHDATWLLDSWGEDGMEVTGCCLNAALSDWARFGEFMLEGGKIDGVSILPEGWIDAATQASQPQLHFEDGTGYQYQWWDLGGGRFAAEGIYGQAIFVDPANDVVIAAASAWPVADSDTLNEERLAAFTAVSQALQ